MAGYMRKLNGYVYDGAHKAAEALSNGVFAEITSDGVKKIANDAAIKMRIQEKTTLWGVEAVVLDVVDPGVAEVFFVENEWDINPYTAYDEANYQCKVGDYVKMHRPVINDQLVMTIGSSLYASLSEGDTVIPASGGSIKKYTPPTEGGAGGGGATGGT